MMKNLAKRMLTVMVLSSFGAVLWGCSGVNVQPSTIDVEARVTGVDGNHTAVPDAVLRLRHDGDGAEPPLVADETPNVQDVNKLSLAGVNSTGLPFQEEWHALLLNHSWTRPGSGFVPVISSQQPSWVVDRLGDIDWLIVRHRNIALPADSTTNFPDLRAAGLFVLARIGDDTKVLPWTRTTCNGLSTLPLAVTLRAHAPAGGADCFDMQSFSSAMLNQLAVVVENSVATSNLSSDPWTHGRVLEHRLHFVPHVVNGALPGFGFIYQASMEADVAGVHAAHFNVSVPLLFHWQRSSQGTFSILVDPGSVAPGFDPQSPMRVAVSTSNGDLSEGSLATIRASIAGSLAAMPLPSSGGVGFDQLLSVIFEDFFLGANGRLPENFDLIALPADHSLAAPTSLVMKMGPVSVADGAPPAPLPGGRAARTITVNAAGAVVVTINLNAAGTSIRTITLPAPTEVMPIELRLLK